MEFRFVVRTEAPETVDAGEFIVEWMRDIGISLKTQAVNDNKLGDIWYSNDYDMYIWGWGVEPDPNFQLSTYTTSNAGSGATRATRTRSTTSSSRSSSARILGRARKSRG